MFVSFLNGSDIRFKLSFFLLCREFIFLLVHNITRPGTGVLIAASWYFLQRWNSRNWQDEFLAWRILSGDTVSSGQLATVSYSREDNSTLHGLCLVNSRCWVLYTYMYIKITYIYILILKNPTQPNQTGVSSFSQELCSFWTSVVLKVILWKTPKPEFQAIQLYTVIYIYSYIGEEGEK